MRTSSNICSASLSTSAVEALEPLIADLALPWPELSSFLVSGAGTFKRLFSFCSRSNFSSMETCFFNAFLLRSTWSFFSSFSYFFFSKFGLQLTNFDVAFLQPGGRFVNLFVDQFSCSLGILLCESNVDVNLLLEHSNSVELFLLAFALQTQRSELWDFQGRLVLFLCLLSRESSRLNCVDGWC